MCNAFGRKNVSEHVRWKQQWRRFVIGDGCTNNVLFWEFYSLVKACRTINGCDCHCWHIIVSVLVVVIGWWGIAKEKRTHYYKKASKVITSCPIKSCTVYHIHVTSELLRKHSKKEAMKRKTKTKPTMTVENNNCRWHQQQQPIGTVNNSNKTSFKQEEKTTAANKSNNKLKKHTHTKQGQRRTRRVDSNQQRCKHNNCKQEQGIAPTITTPFNKNTNNSSKQQKYTKITQANGKHQHMTKQQKTPIRTITTANTTTITNKTNINKGKKEKDTNTTALTPTNNRKWLAISATVTKMRLGEQSNDNNHNNLLYTTFTGSSKNAKTRSKKGGQEQQMTDLVFERNSIEDNDSDSLPCSDAESSSVYTEDLVRGGIPRTIGKSL